jgi:hypothetical protein
MQLMTSLALVTFLSPSSPRYAVAEGPPSPSSPASFSSSSAEATSSGMPSSPRAAASMYTGDTGFADWDRIGSDGRPEVGEFVSELNTPRTS